MESSKQTSPLRTPSDDEVPALLDELELSGESLAAFARARDIRSWKLYKARRRQAPREPDATFAPVRVAAPLVEPPPIEVEHTSGHRLRVPAGFDAATLLRLVEVLESC